MHALLWIALLACGSTTEPDPKPDGEPVVTPAPPGPPAVTEAIEAAPIYELEFTGPTEPVAAGSEVTIGVSYQLPNGCWRWTDELAVDDQSITLSVKHHTEGEMCTQMMVPVDIRKTVKVESAGDWTAALVMDGQPVVSQAFVARQ